MSEPALAAGVRCDFTSWAGVTSWETPGLMAILWGIGVAVLAVFFTALILRERRRARPPPTWPGYPPQ